MLGLALSARAQSNCCAGCSPPYLYTYTVTVYPGSNWLADDLCQGTNNTLQNLLTNVPNGTIVYFWDQTGQGFNIAFTFGRGGMVWQLPSGSWSGL
jgi:hypothetical protein